MWSLVTPDPRSHVCSSIRSLVIGREGTTKALAQVPPLESPYRDKDRKLSPSLPPLVVFVSLVPEYLGGMNPVPPHTHTHFSGPRHLRFRQSPTPWTRCLHNDRCGDNIDHLALSLSMFPAGVL